MTAVPEPATTTEPTCTNPDCIATREAIADAKRDIERLLAGLRHVGARMDQIIESRRPRPVARKKD